MTRARFAPEGAPHIVLGLESSCDETAAAVVRGFVPTPEQAAEGARPWAEILSSVVYGQMDLHAIYGGVVPEIAARAHAEKIDAAAAEALRQAGIKLAEIDAVAVTAGPGLIGGLIAGVLAAQGVALGAGKPMVAVNHLEGHALTARLTDSIGFPYLSLLVSGGHCLIGVMEGPGRFTRLGASLDDAPGEAFDKTAKLLRLGQPGGPAVERLAAKGDATRFPMPRPLLGRPGCDFSFSGLKTALRTAYESLGEAPTDQEKADLCAGFQAAAAEHLARQSAKAMKIFRNRRPEAEPALAVSGGVAANGVLRAALAEACAAQGFSLHAAPLALCGDNGAMIAWAALERLAAGFAPALAATPRARWPLDETAEPLVGSGRKGAKA